MADELRCEQVQRRLEYYADDIISEQALQTSEYSNPYEEVEQILQVDDYDRPYLAVEQVLWIAEYELITDPPTVTLTGLPLQINLGQSAVLTYGSQWADTLVIDHGVGSVIIPSGTATVTPTVTTTYTITATNANGSTTASATITVVSSGSGGHTGGDDTEGGGGGGGSTEPGGSTTPVNKDQDPKGYFRVYQNDCEFRARSWGSTGAYVNMKPIGGPSVTAGDTGADI